MQQDSNLNVLPAGIRGRYRSPVTFKGGEEMVYWRVWDLIRDRGWTRYRLVQESKLPTTTVYTIAKKDAKARRIDGHTLDVLCETLGVGPGDLLAHVPGGRKRSREKP